MIDRNEPRNLIVSITNYIPNKNQVFKLFLTLFLSNLKLKTN